MILAQLSAEQGLVECYQAVGLALKVIEKECQDLEIERSQHANKLLARALLF